VERRLHRFLIGQAQRNWISATRFHSLPSDGSQHEGRVAMSAHAAISDLPPRISQSITGQEQVVSRWIIGLLANGNLLRAGLPGLAKPRAVRTGIGKHNPFIPCNGSLPLPKGARGSMA
jgi:hypothetical protein